MEEPRFIPGYNPSVNENVETGRKGKFWEDQEAIAMQYDKRATELKLRSEETMRLKREINGDGVEQKLEKKSFPALFKAFTSEILDVRKKVAQYNELKDARLMELTGEEILSQSDLLRSEILSQIEATGDPQEKADYDNLRLELDQITRNVSGLPDLNEVNG